MNWLKGEPLEKTLSGWEFVSRQLAYGNYTNPPLVDWLHVTLLDSVSTLQNDTLGYFEWFDDHE